MMKINVKHVAEVFKEVSPNYMQDYDDKEERKVQVCYLLEILSGLGVDLDSEKMFEAVDLDPEMD